jgi:1-deoxyxylulose-5-phosphate synthase
MKYRYVGNTGLIVSRLSLGVLNFGVDDWGCDRNIAGSLLAQFVDAGGNFIDAADIYNKGVAEEIVGDFLGDRPRDELVVGTKVLFPMGTDPNNRGLSRKHIVSACEASLRRLRTDYIDIYTLHGPDPRTPIDETLRAVDDLVRSGKVRYVGFSNFFGWQILKAAGITEMRNLAPLVCGQYMYNLLDREAELEILPACADQGIGMTSWSPLAGGILTGNYDPDNEPPEGSRLAKRMDVDGSRFWHSKGRQAVRAFLKVARESGIEPTRLALSWVLHDPRITAVVVGVSKPEQLEKNIEAACWDMPDDIWAALEEPTRPDTDFLNQFRQFVAKQFAFDGLDP